VETGVQRYPQVCRHCGFEWNCRVENPVQCPKCHSDPGKERVRKRREIWGQLGNVTTLTPNLLKGGDFEGC